MADLVHVQLNLPLFGKKKHHQLGLMSQRRLQRVRVQFDPSVWKK